MLDATQYLPGDQVFVTAREAAPAAALTAACAAGTGRQGHLACASHVVHAPDALLIDPCGPDLPVVIEEDLRETALAPFGLVLSRVRRHGAGSAPAGVGLAIVALRLGLLARMLDQAYKHLEGRESFGQRLIHQPLVKARFAASGALLGRIRAELAAGPAGQLHTGPLHDEIDRHTVQVGKLMGGHGFLAGSLNDLEYLSMLLRASMAGAVP